MLDISVPVPHSHAAHLQRHGTYAHTGYPFMQLAKETGADYGDVLLYADALQRSNRQQYADIACTGDDWTRLVTEMDPHLRGRVLELIDLPVHLRGGNHDQTI